MNNTLLRHWCMLREIPRAPRRIATKTLHGRLAQAGFEIDIRSIQRDLVKLSEILPLMADEAKPQGWSWQPSAPQLDLPALEPQAALVFHLAQCHLASLLPASTLDYLSPWFQASAGVLDAQKNGLATWRDKVRVLARGQPLTPPAIDSEVQATLTQALLQGKRVSVNYRGRNSSATKEYIANPLALVIRDQTIYFVCTLWDYSDIKQLVLHRVASATLLDEPAKPLDGFDLDAYIASGEFGLPKESGKKLKLVARFDRQAAAGLLERPLERGQKINVIDDNTLELTATVANTHELRYWLLGYGENVEVIGPNSLRNEMREIFVKQAERYAK